ncbi:TetR family transcriptional regulator [Corynebacterium mastitidis]
MVAGCVQVPPQGTPVLFLRDHPVTGGYPEETRRLILDAAVRLVRTHGPGVSLSAIAREARVSKGGLLYHFPSKGGLLHGLVTDVVQRFRGQVERADLDAGDRSPGTSAAPISAPSSRTSATPARCTRSWPSPPISCSSQACARSRRPTQRADGASSTRTGWTPPRRA